ncbi:MAG: AAA family ATPase [Candidatus Cloacimonadaceae bacterium]|jgi:chromosome partitioning protein|nr:AAA family ATPase [Candidatus Cloacimonadota bacterium]MDY0127988.1 AAA family ATPase [Candidatus Cloacimonadaceae bacterium]MCB5255348.1 AAA family ATPase [Candidatus Cloacimonadota bacterium]MCK9178235.1 AAA family ATPase [Candidatus Cloacimonadota bacterium]MCK9242227.1 AAA family ATPase [Candidatus Cloacimonadota bacterium]
MAKIITIVNQKGGVGKTTTTVNLAAALAVLEKRTLLIDFDPQGNATSGVGIDKDKVEFQVYDALIGRAALTDCILPTTTQNLYCVPGNIDLTGAEIELVHEFAREHKLKEALQSILNDWDYILIDCPPSLGLLTVNAMTASTDVIVPIQCEYYALEGVSQLLTTIRLIQKNLNPGLNILGILLTMFDKRVNLSMQVAKEVHRYFKEKVFRSVIPRNIKLTEAPSFGKPIFLYDVRSVGAMSYLNLANEVIERYR